MPSFVTMHPILVLFGRIYQTHTHIDIPRTARKSRVLHFCGRQRTFGGQRLPDVVWGRSEAGGNEGREGKDIGACAAVESNMQGVGGALQ